MDGKIIVTVVVLVIGIIWLMKFLRSLRCRRCGKWLDGLVDSVRNYGLSDIFHPPRFTCFTCRSIHGDREQASE